MPSNTNVIPRVYKLSRPKWWHRRKEHNRLAAVCRLINHSATTTDDLNDGQVWNNFKSKRYNIWSQPLTNREMNLFGKLI
jgi:hypothetical protein